MQVWSLGQEYPQEKEMATHSNVLAWRIPWTEEPGGLQSFKEMYKDWSDLASTQLWGNNSHPTHILELGPRT